MTIELTAQEIEFIHNNLAAMSMQPGHPQFREMAMLVAGVLDKLRTAASTAATESETAEEK